MAPAKTMSNLHSDMKYILRVAQIFGLFPLSNMLSDDCGKVAFKWRSPLTLYALFVLTGTVIFVILVSIQLCVLELSLHLVDSFLFCIFITATYTAFFKLSMNWPSLLTDFCDTEFCMRNYGYQANLKKRFALIVFTTTAGVAIEHILAMANTYYNIDVEALKSSNSTRLELYFQREYPFVFDFIEFSAPIALLLFIINNCNVFAWNFIDSFIMIISLALAFRFKQVYEHIIKTAPNQKYISISFWRKVRKDYSRVSNVCQKVNKNIGYLITISFGMNILFVVTQLYKGLTTRRTTVDQCYFVFSFGMIILRLVGVTLCGSTVHTQSKKPLVHLVSLNSEFYNVEVKRLILQIHCHDDSLSGNQFFTITRPLIFEMATVIITYVLFMLQASITIYS